MEILGERPTWSLTDAEKVSRLDATIAVINSMKTYYLQLIADLDASGHAKDIGGGDTARFLSTRYLIDPVEARRDLRLATALPKYAAVADALPDPANPFPDNTPPNTNTTAPGNTDSTAADEADGNAAANAAEGNQRTVPGRPISLAQAAAIVSALEKVPSTVPVENLHTAEKQLVKLARTFTPKQLRDAGARIRHILDTDGPEPDENRAYQRESLTLKPADKGVKFNGFLANENAELFRTLIHAGAKPHKTRDGEPDPRPRDKRQADALTTLLTTAAGVTHTTHHRPATNPTTDHPLKCSAADRDTTTNCTTSHLPNGPTGNRGTRSDAAADPRVTSSPASTRAPSSGAAADRGTSNSRGADPEAGNNTKSRPAASAATPQPADEVTRAGDGTGIGGGTGVGDGTGMGGGSGIGGGTVGGTGIGDGTGMGAGGATAGGYIPGHGPKAHLTITIDYHALKTATTDALGDTVFGDALSAAAVRRLACDAQVIPVVLGSNSQPLDVGTTKRLVTGPMRLALNARDRGCVVCGAPPIQCEAHHLTHWIDGGKTAVSNMVLLCKRHHIDLHAGHWTIEIIDDVVHVTRPTWATPNPVPRGRYRPPVHPPNNRPATSPTPAASPTSAGRAADADQYRPGADAGGSSIRVWPPDTAPRTTADEPHASTRGVTTPQRPTRSRAPAGSGQPQTPPTSTPGATTPQATPGTPAEPMTSARMQAHLSNSATKPPGVRRSLSIALNR